MKVIAITKDLRSGADVIYCQSPIEDYLRIVGDNFEEYFIQRRREKHRAYQRLKKDITDGALLPPITLAVKHHLIDNILEKTNDKDSLERALSGNAIVDILDGLQRTYIISDLKKEGHEFQDNQSLLLEFWLEKDISKLIYRMIVLNSGQKAMSMRHQVELLFLSLKETITNEIGGIEIILERNGERRTQPHRYQLSSIASGYYAFLTASSEVEKEELITHKLLKEDAFDSSEAELTDKFREFILYFEIFKNIDQISWTHYENSFKPETEEDTREEKAPNQEYKNWLGSENTILAFFSAIAQFSKQPGKAARIKPALDILLKVVKQGGENDPLGLQTFDKVKSQTVNPRKVNVGFGTRKLIANGFKEFFREEGTTPLDQCWTMAAD